VIREKIPAHDADSAGAHGVGIALEAVKSTPAKSDAEILTC
jgi:hypothetical protein